MQRPFEKENFIICAALRWTKKKKEKKKSNNENSQLCWSIQIRNHMIFSLVYVQLYTAWIHNYSWDMDEVIRIFVIKYPWTCTHTHILTYTRIHSASSTLVNVEMITKSALVICYWYWCNTTRTSTFQSYCHQKHFVFWIICHRISNSFSAISYQPSILPSHLYRGYKLKLFLIFIRFWSKTVNWPLTTLSGVWVLGMLDSLVLMAISRLYMVYQLLRENWKKNRILNEMSVNCTICLPIAIGKVVISATTFQIKLP